LWETKIFIRKTTEEDENTGITLEELAEDLFKNRKGKT
jgi:hypothetical protein